MTDSRPSDRNGGSHSRGGFPETAKPTVFLHTNNQQLVPALVGAYTLKARSSRPDLFDVRILRLEETPHLSGRNGQRYFWWDETHPATWHRSDLGSFYPLRRMVPAVLGFRGRALVIDPDIFAVGDITELLFRDMADRAILAGARWDHYRGRQLHSSAVMLLDCAKLTSWDWDAAIDSIFRGEIRLGPFLGLDDVPQGDIGVLEEEWNSCDSLNERTKLLHLTKIETQPWRTGLRADEYLHVPAVAPPLAWLWLEARKVRSRGARQTVLQRRHPDPCQERLFLSALRECLEEGAISVDLVRWAIDKRYLRRDLFRALNRLDSDLRHVPKPV